ncbi:DUF551 domain-containing protein [Pantoea stewartii]|uniref:DUF551 domain-containing protein n=1 Tax=Pantoea stewartii TaxID=66269 RepID=UPI0019819B46|nr:DUF551 domain-containing protein [Pantoea stewartii]
MIKLPEINEAQKDALIAHCKECLEIVDRADANIRKSSKYLSQYLQNLLSEHQTQRLNYLITLSYLDTPKIIPDGLHQSTAELVIDFATALAEKLHLSEKKYGWSDGWKDADWQEKCLADFNHHIDKGDPRDVAAYCAFMWFHGWQTQRLNATAQPVSDGWIKCSERMPEDAQWCLVYTDYGQFAQCWSNNTNRGWLGDEISIPNIDVTHWMPLPAAPGGQDD